MRQLPTESCATDTHTHTVHFSLYPLPYPDNDKENEGDPYVGVTPLLDELVVLGTDRQLANLRGVGKIDPSNVGEELADAVSLRELTSHELTGAGVKGQSGKDYRHYGRKDEDAVCV